jgi:hypothetical protein
MSYNSHGMNCITLGADNQNIANLANKILGSYHMKFYEYFS